MYYYLYIYKALAVYYIYSILYVKYTAGALRCVGPILLGQRPVAPSREFTGIFETSVMHIPNFGLNDIFQDGYGTFDPGPQEGTQHGDGSPAFKSQASQAACRGLGGEGGGVGRGLGGGGGGFGLLNSRLGPTPSFACASLLAQVWCPT